MFNKNGNFIVMEYQMMMGFALGSTHPTFKLSFSAIAIFPTLTAFLLVYFFNTP